MAVAKIRAIWSETTSHEAVLEIPDAPPEGPVTQLQVDAAVSEYRSKHRPVTHIGDDQINVEGVELLRAGSRAEVTV